jgi:hypothetical protein
MDRVLYQVVATLDSDSTAKAYIAWLEDGHVDRVIQGGAHSAMIVELGPADDGRPRVMTQYVFSTREFFDRYLREFAPALREEGLAKFGGSAAFARTIGRII